jgi:hypothetical protein
MNQHQFERRQVIYDAFKEEVEWLIESFPGVGDITDWEINYNGMIEVNSEHYHCSCCGPDHDTHYVPVSYLWTENWREIEEERRAAEKRKEDGIKKAKETKAKKAAEEARKLQYEKLKEEFENA